MESEEKREEKCFFAVCEELWDGKRTEENKKKTGMKKM